MKAQASMMEYIFMTFFMMIIITFIVVFLLGIQFLNIDAESSQQRTDRNLALMKALSRTPIFTQDSAITENPVFYDKKLSAAVLDKTATCNELKKLFGAEWSVDIEIIDPDSPEPIICTGSNYENCNKWTICENPNPNGLTIIQELPVSVYSHASGKTNAALMKVSTYV